MRLIRKAFGEDVMQIQDGRCVATAKGLQLCSYIGHIVGLAKHSSAEAEKKCYKVLTSDFFAVIYA